MNTESKKYKILHGDTFLWIIAVALAVVSVVAVYSALGKMTYDHDLDTTRYAFRHFVIVLFSFACAWFISCKVEYQKISQLKVIKPIYYLVVLLLLIVFVSYIISLITGVNSGGAAAQRWLDLKFIQFQPSELAKYVLFIYLAAKIQKYQNKIKEFQTFKRLMIPIVLVCVLIFPEGFSSAAISFVISMAILWLGGVKKEYIIKTLLLIVSFIVVFLILTFVFDLSVFRSQTWNTRIAEWLNSDDNVLTQKNRAKMAIASGGITGNGIGSTIQGRFLNESHTDFIFAVILEETGFVGGFIIILLYCLFFARCITIVRKSESIFGSLVVAGFGLLIFLQAMINIGVAVGYLPITGQTLPLISYGGTSYVITCCALGMIQSVCYNDKKKRKKEEKELIETTTNNEQKIENTNQTTDN